MPSESSPCSGCSSGTSRTGRGSGVAAKVDKGKVVPRAETRPPAARGRGRVDLASLRGKVVVVNFWASWCADCKHEAKTLDAAARAWSSKGVVFLGVDAHDLKGAGTRVHRALRRQLRERPRRVGRDVPGVGRHRHTRDVLHRPAGQRRAAARRKCRVAQDPRRRHPAGSQLVRVVAVVVAALVLAAPAAASCSKHASQSHLETQLVCLECHATLDESNSPVANEMKADVARRIAGCQSEQQILDAMVAQFGQRRALDAPDARLRPARLGAADRRDRARRSGARRRGVALVAHAGGRRAGARARRGSTRADERRVDEELARFDA